jgi:PAS domain S-box-containing protein
MKNKKPERQRKSVPKGISKSPEGSSGDVKYLLQELSVHQEELQAQNAELRRSEAELSLVRDRYKELFDSAPIGYVTIDGSFMIREANFAAASLLGTHRNKLIGNPLSKFMDREQADAYHLHLMKVRNEGTRQSCELVFCRLDGSLVPGRLETSPYVGDLSGNGWRIVLVDITERKRAEAALRKLASDLVMAEERERKRIAGVLHDDIAQTLATVRMRLELLQGIPSDEKDKQTLKEAKALLVQSIQETRALMNDLGNPLLFDMGLKAACESLADRLMDKHAVRISCDIRDAYKHLSPDIKAFLFQLIRELLTNVVKHSHAGNANVIIDMEDGHFRVKVTDDGVGFDSQTLGTPTVDGGYGLYSTRERLIAVDGSLRIISTPGAGTVVTAILPAALD